jgi:hypothetical protein
MLAVRRDGVLEVLCVRCHRRARLFCRLEVAETVLSRAGWTCERRRREAWRCPGCSEPPPSSGKLLA